MSEWRSYDSWLTSTRIRSPSTFHAKRDCPRMSDPANLVNRSESFMAYHEPEPCPHCHDDIHIPGPDEAEEPREPLRWSLGGDD